MSLRALVERLEQLDPACLDAGGVAAGFRELERLKGFVAETEHALARRANVLAAAGSGAPAGDLIERAGHCSPREAQRTSRRAEVLGALPSMSAQLGKGRIGAEHADAVAAVAGRLDDTDRTTLLSLDDELARTAAASTPAQFRRFVGRLADQLAADRGVQRAARQRAAMTLSKGIMTTAACTGCAASSTPRPVPACSERSTPKSPPWPSSRPPMTTPTAATSPPWPSSNSPPPPTGRSGRGGSNCWHSSISTPSPPACATTRCVNSTTAPRSRWPPCDASPATPTSSPSSSMATVSPWMSDAAVGSPPTTNAERCVPCTAPAASVIATCVDRCEIHHLDEWDAHHGDTNLDRLVPACSRHHHLAHEGGWQLHLDPRQGADGDTPNGAVHQRSRPDSVTAPTVRPAA